MKHLFSIKNFFTAAFLFCILFSLPAQAQLTGWRYKDAIKITEHSGAQKINYQVLLTLNTQAQVSIGRMAANGKDIRFAKDCNGSVLYPYWIESGMNTANTKIWVLIDTLPASGNRTINMFYGNSGATPTTSFDSTFTPASRLVVSTGTVTLTGSNNYSWFEIKVGASVIVGNGVDFRVTARKILIAGTLDGSIAGNLGGPSQTDGQGTGHGYAATALVKYGGGGGGSYGGLGGYGGKDIADPPSSAGTGGVIYDTQSADTIFMGSGGSGGESSAGGEGGGGITLIADVVEVSGNILAYGDVGLFTNLDGAGAGGSGGGVRIKGAAVNFTGTIDAHGGAGGSGYYGGGGGGGGRVKIFYETTIVNSGNINVAGGARGSSNNTNLTLPLPGANGTTYQGTWISKIPTYTVLPHVVLSVANNPTCQGSFVTFTATTGYSTYNFYLNNVSVQNSASNTYNNANLNNGNAVKVIAFYPVTGCSDTSNIITMTVNPLPVVTVTPTSASMCANGSANLTASGASTYSWAPSAGLNVSTGASVIASPSVTTTYTVSGTNSNGCSNTATVTVTVNPTPVVTTSASPTSICMGGTSQLTATSTGGSGMVTIGTGTISNTSTSYPAPYGNWYWGARNQFLITAAELSAAGLVAGPITSLAFDVSNVNGAPIHQNFQISMGATTLTSLTSMQSGLTQVMTPVNHQPILGWNTHTFTTPFMWDGISNVIVETCFNNSSYVYNASVRQSSTSYSSCAYFRQDASGVCGNNSLTGTYMQRPNMRLVGSTAVTYNWSPSSSLSSSTINNPVATATATTTYSLVVTATSGCSGTSTVTVTVDPAPVVTVTPSASSICTGGSDNLSANGASSYSWSPASGLNTTTGANVTASPTATTTYTVTGYSPAGCTGTTTVTVTVSPPPTVTASAGSATICNGSSTSITASGASSYAWSPSGSLSSSSGATVTATPSVTTTYTITGTNSSGCTNTTTVTITVDPGPVLSVTPSSPSICTGGSDNLTASGALVYSWMPSSGLNTTTGSVVTASPTVTTTYTVTGANANGCTASTTVTVTVNSGPAVSLGPDQNICSTAQTVLTPGSNFNTYSWSDGSSASTLVVDGTVLGPGVYTYYVDVTNSNGCVGSDTVNVTVSVCTGIADNNDNMQLVIAPNPNNGTFTVNIMGHEDIVQMEVLSLEGQVVHRAMITRSGEMIDVSGLAKGAYLVRFSDGDHFVMKRMIIE